MYVATKGTKINDPSTKMCVYLSGCCTVVHAVLIDGSQVFHDDS